MPFRGVPFVLKDLHAAMDGKPLSNGNIALKNAHHISNYTTEHVKRFIKAGLIIVGRGNSPEFGSVPTTEPEAWGPTRTPWDTSRISGGSSGGSAAAVAAGIVPAAHASDGGGSIRIPAACCGLVGLKVSQGRITSAPFRDETNLGVEHVVTRSVRDCAALLDATQGPGVGDRVIAPSPSRPFAEEVGAPVGKLRIGFLDHRPLAGTIDDECAKGVRLVAKQLEQLGHHVEPAWPKALEDESFPPRFTAIWGTNMAVACETTANMLGREVNEDDFELVNWTMAQYAQKTSAAKYAAAILATSTVSPRRRAVVGRRLGHLAYPNGKSCPAQGWTICKRQIVSDAPNESCCRFRRVHRGIQYIWAACHQPALALDSARCSNRHPTCWCVWPRRSVAAPVCTT